jgi:ribosomal protein S27E
MQLLYALQPTLQLKHLFGQVECVRNRACVFSHPSVHALCSGLRLLLVNFCQAHFSDQLARFFPRLLGMILKLELSGDVGVQ